VTTQHNSLRLHHKAIIPVSGLFDNREWWRCAFALIYNQGGVELPITQHRYYVSGGERSNSGDILAVWVNPLETIK